MVALLGDISRFLRVLQSCPPTLCARRLLTLSGRSKDPICLFRFHPPPGAAWPPARRCWYSAARPLALRQPNPRRRQRRPRPALLTRVADRVVLGANAGQASTS